MNGSQVGLQDIREEKTLGDLYDFVDWSSVDQAKEQFEKDRSDIVDLPEIEETRKIALYNAIQALEGNQNMVCWNILPQEIRRQIKEFYIIHGLVKKEDSNATS